MTKSELALEHIARIMLAAFDPDPERCRRRIEELEAEYRTRKT